MHGPDTVHLGTQYYRAPFPERRYWRGDLERMRDAGLDTVQLWVLWAWVEATPGGFVFDDYDELIRLADAMDLNVVLSTIAEIQPYWIHREVPDCELVDQHGRPVQSVNRGETHFGCTPGGCFDHPGVWERMAGFLHAVAERYASATNLVGWDAWNELRWNVEAGGLTCYCPHTLSAYREWLEERYASLAGLNAAWNRRYGSWDEVWPGRRPSLPYTDSMAFQHFLTCRADAHARERYDIIKGIDQTRPVTVHGGQPSPGYAGHRELFALDRGNDWALAEQLDGIGCSSFPKWQGLDDADFAVRVECVKSAAGSKRVWLSEVQGGRAANGFQVHEPVPARDQQRWIWNGYACGADTILFWCWRDEVFGRESAGFGIIGHDGRSEERLAALRETGTTLRTHGPLLAGYAPDPVQVGVLFSPQSYYHHWAQEGTARKARQALHGVCRALVRRTVPYRVLEDSRLSARSLAGLRCVFLPRATALPDDAIDVLTDWVRAGGTLVTESECGAFGPAGLYRYAEDRFLADLARIEEVGRRRLEEDAIEIDLDGERLRLPVEQWSTPMHLPHGCTGFAPHPDGDLLVEGAAGQGRVIALGSYAAGPYQENGGADPAYERLALWILRRAGYAPSLTVRTPTVTTDGFVHLRTGCSGDRRLLFVFAPTGTDAVELDAAPGLLSGGALTELRTGASVTPTAAGQGHRLHIPLPPIGFAVLAEN